MALHVILVSGFQALSAIAGAPKVQASLDLGSNISGAQKHLRLAHDTNGAETLIPEDQVEGYATEETLRRVVDGLQQAGQNVVIHQAPAKAPWRVGAAESLVSAVKKTLF